MGHFQKNWVECFKCGYVWDKAEEKKSDVQLATRMIVDAAQDRFDAAIVVTGDSDLVPPIAAIATEWPSKAVFLRFPPKRSSRELRKLGNASRFINETDLKKSQLPFEVAGSNGYPLQKPTEWR